MGCYVNHNASLGVITLGMLPGKLWITFCLGGFWDRLCAGAGLQKCGGAWADFVTPKRGDYRHDGQGSLLSCLKFFKISAGQRGLICDAKDWYHRFSRCWNFGFGAWKWAPLEGIFTRGIFLREA